MWVKICGNTSLEDARLAARNGANALGFIFAAGSKRQITPDLAAAITSQLALEYPSPAAGPPALAATEVARIGVVTAGTAAQLAALARTANLTGLQLHGNAVQREAAALRSIAPDLHRIAAFPWAGAADFAQRLAAATDAAGKPLFNALLVDSPTAQSLGGTGHTFPWAEAAPSFAAATAAGIYVIAAGGLNPENVAEAIRILNPAGVDVVSGVEASPGRKDPARLTAFFKAVGTASGRPAAVGL
jgi:phosphoribosylanthranilate isomerase